MKGRKEREKRYQIGRTPDGLRYGFTTGSAAVAASKAAVRMLFTRQEPKEIRLETPSGICLFLDVDDISLSEEAASCCVQKYSGDDPDVTDGLCIYARAARETVDVSDEHRFSAKPIREGRITVTAGEGVGVATKKGLPVAAGEWAINPVPRSMLLREVAEECRRAQYTGSLHIHIWIPNGKRLSQRTFNPRLGIVGGLSILGTSGIVEPMSERALVDTIRTEMRVLKENGYSYCYIVPGNYGADFLEEQIGFEGAASVKCSNFIGETLDMAVRLSMKGVLLVGHIGKFVKLAAGIMNTHSRMADCRLEPLAVQAAMCGADGAWLRPFMGCATTTQAVGMLDEACLLTPVMEGLMERIAFYTRERVKGKLDVETIVFLPERGILGQTDGAIRMQACIREENKARAVPGEK